MPGELWFHDVLISLWRFVQLIEAEQTRGLFGCLRFNGQRGFVTNGRIDQRQRNLRRARNDTRIWRKRSASTREGHSANDRQQYQDRSDFKRQQVLGKQLRADRMR